MASWNDFCPDLKELEKKIGRKTPESLVISLRSNAVGLDGGLTSDREERGDHDHHDDHFSLKIKHLKEEMRRLRRDDVLILGQLVAVHEGLEALRWLEEERGGALASGCSSLTGSLTSLGAADGACWPPLSPGRCSPVHPPEHTPTREAPAGVPAPPDCDASRGDRQRGRSLPGPSARPEGVGPAPGPPARDLRWIGGRNPQTPPISPGPREPRPQGACVAPAGPRGARDRPQAKRLKGCGGGGGGAGAGPTRHPEETREDPEGTAQGPGQRRGAQQGLEDRLEKALFGYDAHWCWVESQDDVTFL